MNPKWITPWLDWGGLWLAQKQRRTRRFRSIQAGLKANPDSEELHMLSGIGLFHSRPDRSCHHRV